MTRAECDIIIEWCKKKIREKSDGANYSERLSGRRLEGYKMAMEAVMSYFHYVKGEDDGKKYCSVTANFLNEWHRMCETNRETCMTTCPLYRDKTGVDVSCGAFIQKVPEKAIEIVQKWSDEHPAKTRLDDLLGKHPKISLCENGLPDLLPARLGYCDDCRNCRRCGSMNKCWHEPLVGGATGRAVE